MALRSTERLTLISLEPRKFNQAIPLGGTGILGMFAREVAIVHGLNLAPLVESNITTPLDPG
jgi:hypothetical protein